MRPIWDCNSVPTSDGLSESEKSLFELEGCAKRQASLSLDAANAVYGRSVVDPLRTLVHTAGVDLTAGCELARAGYFKQAYSLWRSWFEESLLAIYFIEAPLNRAAWRAVDTITSGEKPPVTIMLHQILNASGDKHPFHVVYEERFNNLFQALRITIGKKNGPLKLTEYRLTDLSQGVHGTFRPKPIGSASELPSALDAHALPVLKAAVSLVGLFYFACVQCKLDLSEGLLVSMLDARFAATGSEEGEGTILPLLPQLRAGVDECKKEVRRG